MDRYGGHYVGETVGLKALTAYCGRNSFGHHLWKWASSCCETEQGPSTISHMKRSVRCLNCSHVRENNGRWKGYEDLSGKWLGEQQYGARTRNLEWSVSPEYLWELWLEQDCRCAYTGRALRHGVDASLDRRDNAIGYVVGNLQWVHRDVNRMKTDFTEAKFLNLCREITKHFAR